MFPLETTTAEDKKRPQFLIVMVYGRFAPERAQFEKPAPLWTWTCRCTRRAKRAVRDRDAAWKALITHQRRARCAKKFPLDKDFFEPIRA